MAKLTHQQKLDALAYRFYQGAAWDPKAGDFYTTSRADLELYQVVSVEGGVVRTRFTEGSDAISEWPAEEFLTAGFGPKRVFVPEWITCAKPVPDAWQKMDTAPKDKTAVIIAVPNRDMTGFIVGEAYFDPENYGDGDWWWAGTHHADYLTGPIGEVNYYGPAFWRPLPAAPDIDSLTASGGDHG